MRRITLHTGLNVEECRQRLKMVIDRSPGVLEVMRLWSGVIRRRGFEAS